MPNRRSQIEMTAQEVDEFLHEPGRTIYVASNLSDGTIHLTALWYGFTNDGKIGFTTHRKSQKVKNFERNPQFSALLETGETYGELRGVELVGVVELIEDPDVKTLLNKSVAARYPGLTARGDEDHMEMAVRSRVAVVLQPHRYVSWDHRKLGAE